jgi:signal transduction protein with GAF and PtsI domain
MFRLRRKTRTEKVTEALKEAASYTDRLVRDRRLRADLRAAVDHGALATLLVRRDVRSSRSASRLASDARLRKSLRAVVDDLESAAGRVRRKRKTHRVRNAFLIVGGTGAAVVAATQGRRLLVGSEPGEANASSAPAY